LPRLGCLLQFDAFTFQPLLLLRCNRLLRLKLNDDNRYLFLELFDLL
jgi:hypothetical protein